MHARVRSLTNPGRPLQVCAAATLKIEPEEPCPRSGGPLSPNSTFGVLAPPCLIAKYGGAKFQNALGDRCK